MASKLTNKVQLPMDNYVLRCTEESFGPSKSTGNPMITLKFEIVAPEQITVAGEDYITAGAAVNPHYAVTKSMDQDGNVDIEKSENNKKRVEALYTMFGLPAPADLDNPTLGFVGKTVWALVKSDVVEKRRAPTAEQLKAGQRFGDVMKNPIDGKPLVSYYPKIEEIFGIATI